MNYRKNWLVFVVTRLNIMHNSPEGPGRQRGQNSFVVPLCFCKLCFQSILWACRETSIGIYNLLATPSPPPSPWPRPDRNLHSVIFHNVWHFPGCLQLYSGWLWVELEEFPSTGAIQEAGALDLPCQIF